MVYQENPDGTVTLVQDSVTQAELVEMIQKDLPDEDANPCMQQVINKKTKPGE